MYKRIPRVLVIALLLAALFVQPASAYREVVGFTGWAKLDGVNLPGATFTLSVGWWYRVSFVTNSKGMAEGDIRVIPGDTMYITLSKPGYPTLRSSDVVPANPNGAAAWGVWSLYGGEYVWFDLYPD